MSGKYWDITRTAIRGCSHASRGCDHCWAERMAWRLAHNPNKKISDKYAGLVWRDGWNGDTWHDDIWDMGLPKKGKRILFNCMGDLFHKANDIRQSNEIVGSVLSVNSPVLVRDSVIYSIFVRFKKP